MIDEAIFLIGRAEEGVHYQEVAKGVSRVHLELERNQGKLQVKDVGSRNGTYLNGQLMVAYKAYSLQAGDKLQLASTEGPIYELVG
ncbi:FHA domain-containing protein [Paenibacillus camelliae]|uniref:FHA domain-containing protein n=1 Tax=Paenibacillus camelliae TaxID=512410 RepID=UPI00203F6C33|nr:FHA domain-containing protein [Paenibacillus camelliae]MCM3632624.1 FHA domain-containing protein [Paenibacillus camelliae]